MKIISIIRNIVGNENIKFTEKKDFYSSDWTGQYLSSPLIVVKPSSTMEVSKVVEACYQNDIPIVPISGNTGLSGGTSANHSVVISLERLNKIKDIKVSSRIAIVQAGVILSDLHKTLEGLDLVFPLTFGAKSSAMIGGCLSTNAGGSNVLKYGNTRTLCIGLEVVLPNGQVMNLMNELHKDNTGYDLKNLIIGAEGTLGIITAAVLKLSPKPILYATAMLAPRTLDIALKVLNLLQERTGQSVEAFEYMPKEYIRAHLEKISGARTPFEKQYDINIMVEVGTTIPSQGSILDSGENQLVQNLEGVLFELMESGDILDAVIAKSEAERFEMWERREASAEITITNEPLIITDIAVPLDKISLFLKKIDKEIIGIDANARNLTVAHLGDGNIHYAIYPSRKDEDLFDRINNRLEETVQTFGGSFSAEHGIGLSKKKSMERRKDPISLKVMKLIKNTLDPKNIMNPGKVLPD